MVLFIVFSSPLLWMLLSWSDAYQAPSCPLDSRLAVGMPGHLRGLRQPVDTGLELMPQSTKYWLGMQTQTTLSPFSDTCFQSLNCILQLIPYREMKRSKQSNISHRWSIKICLAKAAQSITVLSKALSATCEEDTATTLTWVEYVQAPA